MYRAPLKSLHFTLDAIIGASALAALPRFADYSGELAESILEEAGRFAEQVLEPINTLGDRTGARWSSDGVHMPAEFRRAYAQFVDAGWPQLSVSVEHGGQGVPLTLASAAEELWFGANVAFMLCPLLGRSAVEALELAGTEALQRQFLARMVRGEWTGTMNLTEAQAGSDLGAIRMRAVPDGEQFRLHGQKIFITYGEHDMAENIVHMVLARIDGAPAGIKGVSLFLVPKFLLDANGNLGRRNDVRCVSIEHKLGIHASPTCVMSYGDGEGAVGYLVGAAHHGIEYMFVMMNSARLSVGVQGIGLTERALQQASAWAHSRVQGHAAGSDAAAAIIAHPDVRRMLLTMKASVEAMRALALYAAFQLDRGHALADEAQARAARARGELLIPVVKGWCTERGIELASLGLQVHGGMGFIEETGAAQTLRDARITSIYEGTTGIQANDLLGRKLLRDRGSCMDTLVQDMLRELNGLKAVDSAARSAKNAAIEAVTLLRDATEALLQMSETPARAAAVAVPYLMLCGWTVGGWLMARGAGAAASAVAAAGADTEFLRGRLQTARFYAEHLLPQTLSLARVVKSGGPSVAEAAADLL